MALILIIDSAFQQCLAALGNNEEVIAHEVSLVQKDHAAFLQPAIKHICDVTSIKLSAIDAVAVCNGPGSYTGLRVGLASAKGICYALNKPLILLNTLDVLAFALQQTSRPKANDLICPMIDARRMEVFTALFNSRLQVVEKYSSVVADNTFLAEKRAKHRIIAGGNGSMKLRLVPGFENIIYGIQEYNIHHLGICAATAYKAEGFSDVVYSEPFYLKPVYFR